MPVADPSSTVFTPSSELGSILMVFGPDLSTAFFELESACPFVVALSWFAESFSPSKFVSIEDGISTP
jgi:hypothetical protein